jgi:undecaprenyl-diphosphatase
MNLLQVILMGIVQGLSEFLPISSSAHLVFTSNYYKIFNDIDITQGSSQEVFLDIMLHLGTLIAVLIFFRKELYSILKATIKGLTSKQYDSEDFRTGMYITIGTFLTIIIALPLSIVACKIVFIPEIVGILLVITGIILLFSEHLSKKLENKKPIDLKSSILIGIAQGLAVLPGFSRSGLTIAAGMFSGSNRETSAKFSFLLSIPIILGASMFYPLLNVDFSEFLDFDIPLILLGTIISGITGYFCIKYFLKFVASYSLSIFGFYCILAGIFSTAFFIIK